MVIMVVESLEGIFPIFERNIGLLVWIDFCEQLLVQRLSQVESSKDVRFGDEINEAFKSHSVGISRGLIKAIFYTRVFMRNDKTDLLDSSKFPVHGTS